MKEYTINMRKDGSAVIAKDHWNHDFETIDEMPYLLEVGMKVVDIFSNVVTISKIHKRPSIDGCAPQWKFEVEENGNTYLYRECAGIFVKELSKEQTELLLK